MGILGRGRKENTSLSGEVLPDKTSKPLKAVAFDLDGTLYPNYRFYLRLLPLLAAHPFFFIAFMRVRRLLHEMGKAETSRASGQTLPSGEQELPFYDVQAFHMAAFLGNDINETRQKVDTLIYKGWEKLFSGIKLFPHVKETLDAFRSAGLKLALLSDFPPQRKISLIGLGGYFNVIFSTEETGALKPSAIPFAALVRSLKLSPDEILYVGNSSRFDVEGARSSGMKAALIRRGIFSTGYALGNGGADFVFRNYRQLQKYVLK